MKDVLRNLGISEYELARTCGEFHVRSLSAIGKGARTDAEGQQVIDLLVEFGATPSPGVPLLAHMREKLEAMTGCRVNLRPRAVLNLEERARVLSNAHVIYPVPRERQAVEMDSDEIQPAERRSTPSAPERPSIQPVPPLSRTRPGEATESLREARDYLE